MSGWLVRRIGEWLGFGPYSHRAQVERDPKMRELRDKALMAAGYVDRATGKGMANGGNVASVCSLPEREDETR